MQYEVSTTIPDKTKMQGYNHNIIIDLLYFCCLGLAGAVFAIGCFVVYISWLVLDLLAFVGLLGVALGSLVLGRVKRVEGRLTVRRLVNYFKNPVWK